MPRWFLTASNIKEAVQRIPAHLEDARQPVYWYGWSGLGASAVLRAIAEHPPPSLAKRFNKIIHIDCSRWISRRALQRAITEDLKLPPWVMAILDRQDEEDDFSGVPEGSRAEIDEVRMEILQGIRGYKCLVVFHNGSDDIIDLTSFGLHGATVLWTFRGRLRPTQGIEQKVEESHLCLCAYPHSQVYNFDESNVILGEEAREIALYTSTPGVTPEIAIKCCMYLLSFNHLGGSIIDYNWAIHASNYWVCDGIIQRGWENDEEAWHVGIALHQQLQLDGYSCNKLSSFDREPCTPPERWVFATKPTTVPPESTSFFLAAEMGSNPLLEALPDDMFHQSEKLHVLKLCWCTFNFISPPFRYCRSLTFLGLDHCKDEQQEEENQERPTFEFFGSLWVLDIRHTDWKLTLSTEIIEQMCRNMREVLMENGRISGNNLVWQRLQNLRKLRVINQQSTLEMVGIDEITDMGKALELLDLSWNRKIEALPSMSGATSLKTLVLDGCIGLSHVCLEELPLLESFSFDAVSREHYNEEAKISSISLAGCAKLVNFKLSGSLPNLKQLDLSSTAIKILDLKDEVVKVPDLQKIVLLQCEQLRSVLWPEKGMPQLRMLCIDTRGGEVIRKQSHDSLVDNSQGYCHAYVATTDIRLVRLLVVRSIEQFCWHTRIFHLTLCISCSSKDGEKRCSKDRIAPYGTEEIIWQPQQKSLIPVPFCCTYTDIPIDKITSDHQEGSGPHFQALDCHLEIGEGISYTKNVESMQGINAINFVMGNVKSLHAHDNSFISSVIPEGMMSTAGGLTEWRGLKQCRVERCPKMHTVMKTNYDTYCFRELETFWAADLSMAHCIWSRGRTFFMLLWNSFENLRSIHLRSCPRLKFVLPLSWFPPPPGLYFPNLETLHIIYCSDLRQVFPVEPEFIDRIATDHRGGTLNFPKLKHIYLHHLPSLEQICEAKMRAPMLETVKLRGCWSLRRLPAVGGSRPVVDCEKDWWEKLEWDGRHVGHHPSLFQPRSSRYYKKPLRRGSLLR